jgi:hypothetical protein
MCSVIVYRSHTLQQNSYPMKEWHLENMKKTVLRYVTGLPATATSYQKRQYKKYSGNLSKIHKSIAFDVKHGVTTIEVLEFLDKVRNDFEFVTIREIEGSMERLDLIKIRSPTSMSY